jgi:hypothetical protein
VTSTVETLETLLAELRKNRDSEISMADEVMVQFITDHNDKAAFREKDRAIAKLASAYDRMEALLVRTLKQAEKIESSCYSYTGE